MSESSEETTVELTEIHEQLEEIRWQLKESQTSLQTLQEQLPAEAAKSRSASKIFSKEIGATLCTMPQEITYISCGWKLKQFSRLVDSPMARVEDFLEDVRGVIWARKMEIQQRVDFMMSNLDRPVKEEIQLLDS